MVGLLGSSSAQLGSQNPLWFFVPKEMAPGSSIDSWTNDMQGDRGQLIFSGAGYANTIEILLDAELHASFCRRGRRRLREIQSASRAILKFDRTRGVLRVTGSDSAIADVQRQLDCLGGPRKEVCNAVWSELMRTRMSEDATSSAVQRIQQLSDCRVHIERSTKEVRLFGPKPAVATASQLLEDLRQMCTEQVVDVADAQSLPQEAIAHLAGIYNVSIGITEDQVVIAGFEFAVSKAFKAFLSYALNTQQDLNGAEPDEEVAANIAAALAKLQLPQDEGCSGVSTSGSLKAPLEDSDGSTEGGEERRPSGSQGQTSAHQSAPAASQPANPSHECCPTCGTTNFCVGCGAPNEHFQLYQMKLVQSQMSMMPGNVGQMMMPVFPGQNGFVPVCMPAGMVPMAQQPIIGSFEGCDNSQPTGVYLMPAQMVQGIQPGMMVCDGSKTAYSM